MFFLLSKLITMKESTIDQKNKIQYREEVKIMCKNVKKRIVKQLNHQLNGQQITSGDAVILGCHMLSACLLACVHFFSSFVDRPGICLRLVCLCLSVYDDVGSRSIYQNVQLLIRSKNGILNIAIFKYYLHRFREMTLHRKYQFKP